MSVNTAGIRKLLDDLDFASLYAERTPGLAMLSAGDNDALYEHVLELLGDDADAIIEFIDAADDETRRFLNEFGGSIIEAHPTEKMLNCLCNLCEDDNARAMLIDYSEEFLNP